MPPTGHHHLGGWGSRLKWPVIMTWYFHSIFTIKGRKKKRKKLRVFIGYVWFSIWSHPSFFSFLKNESSRRTVWSGPWMNTFIRIMDRMYGVFLTAVLVFTTVIRTKGVPTPGYSFIYASVEFLSHLMTFQPQLRRGAGGVSIADAIVVTGTVRPISMKENILKWV